MGIKFSSFPIRGIDVSEFNGVIDWTKVQATFAVIRVGYGNSVDRKFVDNITLAQKQKIGIAYYWYMDYYNNHISGSSVYGMGDAAWGRKQADSCWNAIKNYKSGMVFIDIESTNGNYAPKIETVQERAQTIMGGFLSRMDELNKKTNGIYCSLGLLNWFYSKWRSRPLWVAWYPYRTSQVGNMAIVQMVIDKGWYTKPLIWQYASDGMVNDDGIKMGKTYFKTQLEEMDLNGWVGPVEQYEQMFSTNVVIPDPIETPDDEVIVTPPANTRVIEVKTSTRTLTLRKKPLVSWLTQIRTYPAGTKFDCLEKVTVNGNTWQRVGIDQYIADTYDGIQYLK